MSISSDRRLTVRRTSAIHGSMTNTETTETIRITGETVTDQQIRALRTEAGAAGDMAQVQLCTDALAGVYSARALCAEAITAARAMAD